MAIALFVYYRRTCATLRGSVELPCLAKGDRTNRFPNQNIHCRADALIHLHTQKLTPVLAFAGAGVSRLNQIFAGRQGLVWIQRMS